MNNTEKTMEKIVALCKSRGFIFPGSDIYGGLANTWDYGPLGSRLKNNVKDTWRKRFIQERRNSYEVDADILMHPRVWEASGHVQSFSDPLLDCKECKMRHRADNLIDDFDPEAHADGMTKEEMFQYIKDHSIPCPNCGKHNFTDIREFNLMFQTFRGVTNDSKMEFQTFCKEGTDSALYDYFKEYGRKYFEDLGIAADHLRYHDHEKLAHYAKAACDIEFLFPFGWGEINGTHNRTDFDLTRHQEYSGQKMDYLDPSTNEKFIPYIIESTYGLDRTVLALLCEAYDEEVLDAEKNDTRVVLHLSPAVAPYKAAVLPLSKKLSDKAWEVCDQLSKSFMVDFDETGSIGKRYRREDEIGTPYCITYDFDSETDNCVTVRDRDTMEQVRIPISELEAFISDKIKF